MSEIAGDGSRPDFSDVVYPGISAETVAELDALYTQLNADMLELTNRVKAANNAKDALLSWAALGEKLVDTVLPIVQHFISLQAAKTPGTAAPGGNKLKDALLGSIGIFGLPAEQRSGAISSLLGSLLG